MRGTVAVLLAILAAGCGLADPVQPEWVTNRRPLPACEAVGPSDFAAQECLFDAYLEGRDAELIQTATDARGRPVTTYLRVHANGTIESFRDLYGDAIDTWERMRCQELVPVEEAGGPPQPSPAGPFIITGCEMLPLP